MANVFMKISETVILLTLVLAAIIHGISYLRFLWRKTLAEGKDKN